MKSRSALRCVLLVSILSGCRDQAPDTAATRIEIVQSPSSIAHSAQPLFRQPIIQLTDRFGVPVPQAGRVIAARIASGGGSLTNASATTDSTGRASFLALSLTGVTGAYTIQFESSGMTPSAAASVAVTDPLCVQSGAMPLDLPLGASVRFEGGGAGVPPCLEFSESVNGGQQYLVMFENLAHSGGFDGALFPGASSASDLGVNVSAIPVGASSAQSMQLSMRAARLTSQRVETEAPRDWDFGGGAIYEGTPAPPPALAPASAIVRGSGAQMSVRSAVPSVGDTIQLYLAGIDRLNIQDGTQKAVVRFLSNELIFAEDVRLGTTLVRGNGARNKPLTIAQMDTLAREYASYARVQGESFFMGRFNGSTEAQDSRVTVVHTLMYSDSIWGYTYPNMNYFAFDYWVATDGSTPGSNQILQRVADNLFMHEIAHIRHYGMLERATPTRTGKRGNQWLTEGFARFSERLPIAMRLLGSTAPSRTSNFVLMRNPVFNNSYFFDDVPTYLNAGGALFSGYSSSSYIFDYLADQVALSGGDYMAAVRDLLVNGGVEADANAAVGRWLPGVSFGALVTRARIALYTDDYGVTGLPGWTQYQQYQLRASRPPGSRAPTDPRNAWPRITPGSSFTDSRTLPNGTAFGYLIDGTAGTASTRITVDPAAAASGVISITRIR